MTTKIQDLISEYVKARTAFLEQGKEAIGALFKQFFADNPGVKIIIWEQYSPYFNDGDECVFSVRSPVFSNATSSDGVNSWDIYEGDEEGIWQWGDDQWSEDSEFKPTDAEVAAMEELNSLIQSSALEDVFYDLFGNHAKVTVTPNGIETDVANHD